MMRKQASSSSPPEVGDGRRGEDGYFGYLLRQAAAGYRQSVERALVDLDVTPPQFAVLTMLNAYPGHSGADLARLSLLTPQTVSVIVANLERAGSVVRRAHAVHGRIQHIDLSESGRAVLARCRARVHVIEAELTQDLTADEERLLRRWLVRVATTGGPRST